MPGLDALLLAHLARQVARLATAGSVLVLLVLWGRRAAGALGAGDLPPAERLLVDVGIGFGILSATLRLLGAAGLFLPSVVWGVSAVGALLLAPRREDVSLHGLFRWRSGGPVGGAVLLLALAPIPLALAPAVSWDALAYHLRTPERALADGFWLVDRFNFPTSFPSAHGTLYGLTLVGDPEGVAAQLLCWGLYLATLLAIGRIAARLAGDVAGWAAAALYASVPAAGTVAGFAWSDTPLVFALATAALSLVHGAAPAGLALLGLAAAIKYTGIAFAIPLAVAALLVLREKRGWARGASGAVLGAAVAAPWYGANLLATGNPVYPLLPGLFGGSSLAAERLSTWSLGGSVPGLPGWLRPFWAPASVDADLGGPLLLIVLVVGWIAALFVPKLRGAAFALALTALLLSWSDPASRVFLPLVAASAVLASAALVRWTDGSWRGRIAGTAVLILCAGRGVALIAGHAALFFRPLPAALGLESDASYVRRNFPPFPLYERAASLPPGSRCLCVGEPRLFRFPRATSAGAWADDLTPIAAYLRPGRGVAGDVANMRSDGFTHLLMTADAIRRAHTPVAQRRGILSGSLDALLSSSSLVDREGDLALYALPQAVPVTSQH